MATQRLLVLNFSRHPLTPDQLRQIRAKVKRRSVKVVDLPDHFDDGRPYRRQVNALFETVDQTAPEWTRSELLVRLPSYNFAAAVVLARLHGRLGNFPTILRLRQVKARQEVVFRVAEFLPLQRIRNGDRRA